ncbi:hypothetical protein THRCLA_11376 [Thraustotheca clavata]|uniref:RRM domain-containing protein n=1 Tax=Thraustotheca clavata TaxID=74557 RepID=A0A1V9Y7W6_9STRA|nr:hypothetical protein THRCLA_11376 [Thraustotheca clavata]
MKNLKKRIKYVKIRKNYTGSFGNWTAMVKLFVGNLNSNQAREEDLRALFEKCGKISDVIIKLGYGFIEFEDEADADEAIKTLNLYNFLGKEIHVTKAHTDEERVRNKINRDDIRRQDPWANVNRCRSLFVGNIVPDTTIDKLTEFFEQFGKVENIKVLPQRNGNTGISAFVDAFVDFSEDAAAAKAMEKRLSYEGRDLRTDYSNRRGIGERRSSPDRRPRNNHDDRRSRNDSYDDRRSRNDYDDRRSRNDGDHRPRQNSYDNRSRGQYRRSQSPKRRELSPRRSASPKRREYSPRRRDPSPRARRDASPRRREPSPRRRSQSPPRGRREPSPRSQPFKGRSRER